MNLYQQLTSTYMDRMGEDLSQVEWELIETLDLKNKDLDDKDSKMAFESVFCKVVDLEIKYNCENCDDTFYEHNCHSSLDNPEFDGKEYHICPNCGAEDLSEVSVSTEVDEFYKIEEKV
jgi:hypothetical protein